MIMTVHHAHRFAPVSSQARLLVSMLCSSSVSSPLASFLSRQQFETAKHLAVSKKWSSALPVEDFLERGGLLAAADGTVRERVPVLDVRAPCEYASGHVPGAISVPLFSDEERAEVGTLYKHAGHDEAVGECGRILPAPLASPEPCVSHGLRLSC